MAIGHCRLPLLGKTDVSTNEKANGPGCEEGNASPSRIMAKIQIGRKLCKGGKDKWQGVI
jgi:hypothetical protein